MEPSRDRRWLRPTSPPMALGVRCGRRSRRTGFRRAGEGHHAYVDGLAWRIVGLAVLVYVSSLLDALLTLLYLEDGGWGGESRDAPGLGVWSHRLCCPEAQHHRGGGVAAKPISSGRSPRGASTHLRSRMGWCSSIISCSVYGWCSRGLKTGERETMNRSRHDITALRSARTARESRGRTAGRHRAGRLCHGRWASVAELGPQPLLPGNIYRQRSYAMSHTR